MLLHILVIIELQQKLLPPSKMLKNIKNPPKKCQQSGICSLISPYIQEMIVSKI